MKSPFHFILGLPGHIRHADKLFDHFHRKLHHAFMVFGLAIIGMLRGASHIMTPASATRQRGGFMTSDFRDQSPSNANIMYALFGDGTPGSTAYTRLRDSSCIPTNIVTLTSTGFSGGTGVSNTIYILNPGTYTLTSPIVANGDCSAIIGKGDVIIKASTPNTNIHISYRNNIILDNIHFDGNSISSLYGINISTGQNISINNIDSYQNHIGLHADHTKNIFINGSRFFKNTRNGIFIDEGCINISINNILAFDNHFGIGSYDFEDYLAISNTQTFNNTEGMAFEDDMGDPANVAVVNSISYNNIYGIDNAGVSGYLYNITLYNNNYGINQGFSYGGVEYYGSLHAFNNTMITGGVQDIIPGSSSIIDRGGGTLDLTNPGLSYDRTTNPQNGSGQWLLSGTNRTGLRNIQTFDPTKKPIRYIFGGNIPRQITPVSYNSGVLQEYGNDGSDYKTVRYIAEPESTLPAAQQTIVNQYFGSGSTFTQNRLTNGCSLSAFQIVYLNPGTFSSTYNFQDHTIYILTGGEYQSSIGGISNGFVFNGNCIALVGTDDTRFTKAGGGGMNSILYANNKRNIIIDDIKADAKYFGPGYSSAKAQTAIDFEGASNNSTINNVQAYNASAYGIYLGLGSHHNTIINVQAFNNISAGIHLYYSSNYNVINNTQTYNNANYGIRFANGSNRNTMNNFQAYNNVVGVFGDLTTQENVLNRAAIYNNSDAGIYLKNSSSNALNDVRIYNNGVGIRTLYNSPGNKYYGEFKIFDNVGDFDGTSGNDSYLSAGAAGFFPYPGALSTGSNIVSCLYATNPTLTGYVPMTLLSGNCTNTGYASFFESPDNAYVHYAFGLSMYKQKLPYRYNSGNFLIPIPSQYNSGKYIAEVFAIRDDTPENVIFVGSGSAPLNTWYTTNVYTAGVINITVPVTLSFLPATTSGYLIISGHNGGLTGIVNNGDTIQISVLTQTGYNQTTTGIITIGTVTTGFTVTTKGFNQMPTTGSLAFANLTSIPFNTFTGSTTTIAGLETGVYASITFAPSTTSGRLEIYSGTTLVNSGTTGLLVYNGYQVKAIAQSSSGYAQTVTGYVTIGLGTGVFTIMTKGSDATPPTAPVITYPLSGEKLFFVEFERTASIDTGSGLDGYIYQIADDTAFTHIVNTGTFTSTGITGFPNANFDPTNDIYYRRIQAKDRDGNPSARSATGSFETISFSHRKLNAETDANLRAYYDSNSITLTGIKQGLTLRAGVDGNGVLYKNGSNKGTGAFVTNGDVIYISLRSSNQYDDLVSSTLTIANKSLRFDITTKDESDDGCTLSDDDKDTIQIIFSGLVENYSGDENKFDEFLATMESMLADEIDFTNDCNLQYLEDLINAQFGPSTSGSVNTGNRIAPNCKEYPVSFDASKIAYTSPSFKVVTYFANRDSLARYIDSKNPGDCHINSYGASSRVFTNTDPSKHIAPNGKLYSIASDSQGYTSNDFAVKRYFSTIGALRSYIDNKNIPSEIRSHQVDTSFTPQTYTAPNGKSYTIYKTDRGYMSYKLMKVRYFPSLTDIESFINYNNR